MKLIQDGVIDTLPMYDGYRPGPPAATEIKLDETVDFEFDARLAGAFS